MKAYFLSDQHLISPEEEKCQSLLRFFKGIQSTDDCSDLFLLGDIFDLWAGSHEYFIKKWHPFNVEILRLINLGVRVHYFEGNHDLLLSDYFYTQLGVRVYVKPEYFTIDGKVYRIEHGDQMDPEDHGYLVLRRFWRSLPVSFLIKKMSGQMVQKIGDWASETSRKYHSVNPSEQAAERIRKLIRKHVQKAYKQKPFDIFVSGHLHLKDEQTIDVGGGKTVRAINLGFQEPPVTLG